MKYWREWIQSIGVLTLGIGMVAGAVGLFSLILPDQIYVLLNVIFFLLGFIFGGAVVMQWIVLQLKSAIDDWIQILNQMVGIYQYPSLSLPPDTFAVILAKPVRPQNPVYRVLRGQGRDRYFSTDGATSVFHSNPEGALLWRNQLDGLQAAVLCAESLDFEEQVLIEEIEASTVLQNYEMGN